MLDQTEHMQVTALKIADNPTKKKNKKKRQFTWKEHQHLKVWGKNSGRMFLYIIGNNCFIKLENIFLLTRFPISDIP